MGDDRIQFVSSISDTATVRLSLSASPWRVMKAGTDLSPPPLRRAVNTTLLADGAYIPAAAFDNRVIKLHLQLDHGIPETSMAYLQLLRRELDRPTNILRWQPDTSLAPVYFRTFRAPDTVDDIDHGINLFDLTAEIPAEPFAYGLRVDGGPVTVSNDPINTGSNGKFFDITSVQGDVETPLQIRMAGSDATGRQTMLAVRRRGTPSAMPFFLQCESMTLGTDAATVANSANYSGAGNNSVAVTPGTTALTQRLSTSAFPSSGSVDVRGTYRVFVRAIVSAPLPPSGSFTVQLRHGARAIANSEVSITRLNALDQIRMVDLGLVQIPEGYDPAGNGPEGAVLPAAGIPLSIWASKITGTALTLDYLLFVPADDKLVIVNWGSSSPTTFVLDGTNRMIYGLNASSQVADISPAYFVGDPPMVSPGQTNRIVVIRDVVPSTSNADLPATTYPISYSYWPRYLYVRPVAS